MRGKGIGGRGMLEEEGAVHILLLISLTHVLLLLIHGNCGMVIETLRHQMYSQPALLSRRLLYLGALILEPNLDLRLV